MDFSLTPTQLALQERTRQFIADKIIPLEKDPRATSHGPTEDLRAQLVGLAREAGLLTPHASIEMGGLGLSHSDKAVVFEEAGYSTQGPATSSLWQRWKTVQRRCFCRT